MSAWFRGYQGIGHFKKCGIGIKSKWSWIFLVSMLFVNYANFWFYEIVSRGRITQSAALDDIGLNTIFSKVAKVFLDIMHPILFYF